MVVFGATAEDLSTFVVGLSMEVKPVSTAEGRLVVSLELAKPHCVSMSSFQFRHLDAALVHPPRSSLQHLHTLPHHSCNETHVYNFHK